jgi:predicted 2-oxoglutarate/Fe(II)-dependent dioxygenase YbiX
MEKIFHHPKIVEIKEFLDKHYCLDVIEFLDGNDDEGDNWNPICFPSVLGVNVGEPKATNKISVEDMGRIRDNMHNAVVDVIGKAVKNVTMSGHKYPTGSYADPHSDSSELDGTPNAWQMNKYACILYLNDSYDGGAIYFPQHNLDIHPGAGSLVVFEGSHEYLHGVREITNGDRFTILAFWDDESSTYDKEFLDKKVELQRTALDYVESSHDYGSYNGRTFGKQKPEDLYSILRNTEDH